MELFKILGKIAVDNSEANSAIDETSKRSKEIGEGFKESKTTASKSLKEIAEQNGTTVNELRSKAMTLASEYKKQGMSASEATKKAYADIGYEAQGTHEKINSEIDETSNRAEKSESRISSAFKKIGAAVVTYFAVDKIKDFGMACVEAGAAFDAQMSTVSAISGATGEDLDALREKAKELGAQTSFSATESAQAMEYMAMAGWKTEDMLNGLEGVMNLAAASGEDLATTSDIVTDAMTAFGLSAADSGHFADILAVASSNANTNVSMMGETFKYVAPVAGALNISAENTAEAIGLMANAGIKSSQAGTTLRSILTRLSTDAGASSKSLGALGTLTEELGVEFYDSEGKVRDFGTILSEAREQWQTLSAEDSATFAKKIAGEEGISGWLALMNAAPADIEKLSKAIKNCDGAAKEMSETRLDNLQGDVTLFKSALEGAQIAISDKLSPHLRKFVQGATELMPKALNAFMKVGKYLVNTFSPAFSSLKGLFKSVSSVLEPVIKQFLGISDAEGESTESSLNLKNAIEFVADIIKTTSDVVSDFIGWLSGGSTGAEVFKGVISALATGFVFYKGVMLAVNIAETAQIAVTKGLAAAHALLNSMSPFGWAAMAATALGALVVAAVKMSEPNNRTIEEFAKLSEEEQALRDKTNELTESYNKWSDARNSTTQNITEEFGTYETLAEELDNIVDKNGKIKDGYEERAGIITGELSEALGIEIEIVDGVIQKYSELQQSISDTIELQKAQAIQEGMKDSYLEALQNIDEAQSNYNANLVEYNETFAEVKDAQERLNAVTSMTTEEFERNALMLLGSENAYMTQGEAIKYLQDKYDGLSHKFSGVRDAYIESENAFTDYSTTIKNYEGVTSAIMNKDADEIIEANDKMLNSFQTAETGTERSLQNQVNTLKNEYENMLKASQQGNAKISEEDLKSKEELYKQAESELNKYRDMHGIKAAESGDEFTDKINSKTPEIAEAGRKAVDAWGNNFLDGLHSNFGQIINTIDSYVSYLNGAAGSSSAYVNSPGDVTIIREKISSAATATGGIVTRPQTRLVGEDGPEAIVPLKNNTEWIDLVANKVAKAMGRDSGGTVVNYIFENVNMNSDSDIEEAAYKFEAMRQKAAMAMGGD